MKGKSMSKFVKYTLVAMVLGGFVGTGGLGGRRTIALRTRF